LLTPTLSLPFCLLLPRALALFPYTTLFRSGLRDGGPAVVRQLRLVKDLLDPVHAAVHDGQPGGLGIQGLDGAEQVKDKEHDAHQDRKSTRLNSSHVSISYAVFCLKKKKAKK